MQTLFQTFYRLVERVSHTHQRYLYHIIDWDERLIGIKGARGVGKTTMVLQHIRHAFPDRKRSRCGRSITGPCGVIMNRRRRF